MFIQIIIEWRRGKKENEMPMGVNLICRSICIRSVLGSYWTYLMWLMMRLEAGMKKSSTRSKRRPTGCVWTVWWETLPLAWLITWWIPMEEEVGVKHEPDEYIQCCWILPTCSWSYNTNTHVLIIFSWSFISQKQCTINTIHLVCCYRFYLRCSAVIWDAAPLPLLLRCCGLAVGGDVCRCHRV